MNSGICLTLYRVKLLIINTIYRSINRSFTYLLGLFLPATWFFIDSATSRPTLSLSPRRQAAG